MTRYRFQAFYAIGACLMLGLSACTTMQNDPPMTNMVSPLATQGKSDREAAADYRAEATMLREKARSHRKFAQNFRAQMGKVNYSQIARHCDNLAQQYELAATEADAISSELIR